VLGDAGRPRGAREALGIVGRKKGWVLSVTIRIPAGAHRRAGSEIRRPTRSNRGSRSRLSFKLALLPARDIARPDEGEKSRRAQTRDSRIRRRWGGQGTKQRPLYVLGMRCGGFVRHCWRTPAHQPSLSPVWERLAPNEVGRTGWEGGFEAEALQSFRQPSPVSKLFILDFWLFRERSGFGSLKSMGMVRARLFEGVGRGERKRLLIAEGFAKARVLGTMTCCKQPSGRCREFSFKASAEAP